MKNKYPILVFALIALAFVHSTQAGVFDANKKVANEVAIIHETNGIDALAFSPDGSLLVVAKYFYTHSAQVWDWRHSSRVGSEFKHRDLSPQNADALQFSTDGREAVWCGYIAAVWRINDGVETFRHKEKTGENNCEAVTYTPKGDTLVMSQSSHTSRVHTLATYDTRTWQLAWKLETSNFFSSAFSLSFDGRFVAIGGKLYSDEKNNLGALIFTQRILIFDLLERRQVRDIPIFSSELDPLRADIAALAWGADGRFLAVGFRGVPNDGADAIRILDAATGGTLSREPGPRGTHVRGIRFTSDGKYLIVAGIGKSVKIWDGQHIKLLQEIPAEAASIAVSQDGHYLALGGGAFGLGNITRLLGLLAPSKGKAIIYQLK
ncbi:MAG: WD40 repeat domain-containing protein [Burkholderiaceae bacterium]|nr:WD40 repeat domain-containing protein [Burkholderiaceae bacterium]